MTEKEYKDKKDLVLRLANPWIRRLGLAWYAIEFEWKAGIGEDKGDNYNVAAQIVCRWMYRTATISVYLEMLPEDEEEVEHLLVHELCHIFVNPLRSSSSKTYDFDLEEYVVENMCKAFIWTYQFGKEDVSKPKSNKGKKKP